MRFLTIILASLLTSCGIGVSDSEHDVNVSGETTHIIRFVVGNCDQYESYTKREKCEERYENYLNKLSELLQAQSELEEVTNTVDEEAVEEF